MAVPVPKILDFVRLISFGSVLSLYFSYSVDADLFLESALLGLENVRTYR
jgi:hypothetical protein